MSAPKNIVSLQVKNKTKAEKVRLSKEEFVEFDSEKVDYSDFKDGAESNKSEKKTFFSDVYCLGPNYICMQHL